MALPHEIHVHQHQGFSKVPQIARFRFQNSELQKKETWYTQGRRISRLPCFSFTKNQKECLRSGIPLKFEILSVQVFTHPFLGIQMFLLVLSARLSLALRVQKLNRCERLNHPSGSKWDIYKWYKCTCQCWRWTCHSILCPYISVSPQGVKEGMYSGPRCSR